MPVTTTTPTVIDIQDDAGLSSARRQTIERITTSDDAVVILSTDKTIEVNTYEDTYNSTQLTQFNTYNNAAGLVGYVQLKGEDGFAATESLRFDVIGNYLSANAIRTDYLQDSNGQPYAVGNGGGIVAQVNGNSVLPGQPGNTISWNNSLGNNRVLFTSPGNGQIQASLDSNGVYTTATTIAKTLIVSAAANTGSFTLRYPNSAIAQSYLLPAAAPTGNNQVLAADTSNNTLYWAEPTNTSIANGTSTVSIPAANGAVSISPSNRANVLVVGSSGITANTNLTVNTELTVGNTLIVTPTNTTLNSPITFNSNLTANIANLRFTNNGIGGFMTVAGNGVVTANANIFNAPSSNVLFRDIAAANARFSGNVTAGNITANTSVTSPSGSFTTLSSNGTVNFATAQLVTTVSNLFIGGGNAGQVLTKVNTGGSTVQWANVPAPTVLANATATPNSRIDFSAGGANIQFTINDTQLVQFSAVNATFAQAVTVSANANVNGDFRVAGRATVVGPLASGPLTVTGNTQLTGNASVSGNVRVLGISAANTINLQEGNVTSNNVTVTNLISTARINATGNVLFTGGNVSLGSNSTVRITGGSIGQVLTTDGTGNLSWSTQGGLANGNSSITIPVSNGNVVITAGGNAVANFTGNSAVFSQRILASNAVISDITGVTNITLLATASNSRVSLRASTSNLVVSNSSYTLFMPANAGANGQVLSTDGTGNLSWVTNPSNPLSNGTSRITISLNSDITLNPGSGNTAVLTANATSGVSVSANFRVANTGNAVIQGNAAFTGANVSLGNVSNLHIVGGNSGQVLVTNGMGSVSWRNPTTFANIEQVITSSYDISNVANVDLSFYLDVLAVSTASATTITLPVASANLVGKYYIIKDTLGAARPNNAITIVGAIDGAANFQITEPYNSVTVACLSSSTWGII